MSLYVSNSKRYVKFSTNGNYILLTFYPSNLVRYSAQTEGRWAPAEPLWHSNGTKPA